MESETETVEWLEHKLTTDESFVKEDKLKQCLIDIFKHENNEPVKLILEHINDKKIEFKEPIIYNAESLSKTKILQRPDLLQELIEKKIVTIEYNDPVELIIKIFEGRDELFTTWDQLECFASILSIDNLEESIVKSPHFSKGVLLDMIVLIVINGGYYEDRNITYSEKLFKLFKNVSHEHKKTIRHYSPVAFMFRNPPTVVGQEIDFIPISFNYRPNYSCNQNSDDLSLD